MYAPQGFVQSWLRKSQPNLSSSSSFRSTGSFRSNSSFRSTSSRSSITSYVSINRKSTHILTLRKVTLKENSYGIAYSSHKAESRFVPIQWETALLSHWLGANLESALLPWEWPHMSVMASEIVNLNELVQADNKENIKDPHDRFFVKMILRWPMDSLHKRPVMGILFLCYDILWHQHD